MLTVVLDQSYPVGTSTSQQYRPLTEWRLIAEFHKCRKFEALVPETRWEREFLLVRECSTQRHGTAEDH